MLILINLLTLTVRIVNSSVANAFVYIATGISSYCGWGRKPPSAHYDGVTEACLRMLEEI
ncbi:MAG: hypothetical protein ACTS8H_04565 [Arsenophonus sp. NC-PE1-MAG3]